MISALALALRRHRRTLRILFWLYALALFVGTHWPALEVHVEGIERVDLLAHFTLFGAWFTAFWLTGYVGDPFRARSIILSAVIACLYAGLDEGLQAIPWVRRHCAWDDYAANCIGITLAAFFAAVLTVLVKAQATMSAPSAAKSWLVAALAGAGLGALAGLVFPIAPGSPTPLGLCIPFAALLLAIAIAPLTVPHAWHAHYPSIALALGGLVLGYELVALRAPGAHDMLHAAVEYYQFIALVGGLFVASGGILISIRGGASPLRNTALLAAGALLANLLGTTGASVLLIRPYMRMNRGRMRPFHLAMFIFIVSNCGGALTPIGDPPLYLGYLKGIPFFWTLTHMWPMWLLANGLLLTIFFIVDLRLPRAAEAPIDEPAHAPVLSGLPSAICLLLLVAAVFIDPAIQHLNIPALTHLPIGATVQLLMALAAHRLSTPAIRVANQFSFEPVKEVGFLFAGIFLTMVPALGFLRTHASSLGLDSPTQFYFFTGGLSAVLDNAPTYLSFLQTALGLHDLPMTAPGIQQLLALHGPKLLEAISLGAVFFGAMTYIGNGPNFMVRSIVDSTHAAANRPGAPPDQARLGTPTPSFLAYLLYALVILLPILVLNWLIFIR